MGNWKERTFRVSGEYKLVRHTRGDGVRFITVKQLKRDGSAPIICVINEDDQLLSPGNVPEAVYGKIRCMFVDGRFVKTSG